MSTSHDSVQTVISRSARGDPANVFLTNARQTNSAQPFLTAAWRRLAIVSFAVDPQILQPLVPRGTLLDECVGQALVSVVGFWFERARLFGLRIPWHQHFAEVNLRFYVRREVDGQSRRGVVFIKEMVPRRCVAWTARLYGERFARVPLACAHNVPEDDDVISPRSIQFDWESAHATGRLAIRTDPTAPRAPAQGEAAFVVDRYWAYTARRDGSTWEYRVAHRAWQVWPAAEAELTGNLAAFYGPALGEALRAAQTSAVLVDGSAVAVYRGRRIWPAPTNR